MQEPEIVLNGILNLDKPDGLTSHDCVARLRRILHTRRIGHAGTLDPMATGVLVVCVGAATRLSDLLMDGPKVYRADVTFGASTDTQDATGRIVEAAGAAGLTLEALTSAIPAFTGDLLQTPPMVSAVHHQGKRLYEWARAGIEVDRPARRVRVHAMTLLHFTLGDRARAEIEVTCSAGTYVRTLAHDLGLALGCGGHLAALRRLAVGPFRIEESTLLADVEARAQFGDFRLMPMTAAFADRPTVLVPAEGIDRLRHGGDLDAPAGLDGVEGVGLIGPTGELAALARGRAGRLYPYKVLLP